MTMLRTPLKRAVLLAAALVIPAGCASKQVTRIDPDAVTDLSGRWNDTDSRLVANALIEQSLGHAWASRYAASNGGAAPAVIVGDFANRSHEHIAVGTFIRDLEAAFINSGAVRVVATADERSEVRSEREDQQEHARADTRARMAQELGAQYMLQGDIQTISDEEGRERVMYYQIDARLVDLESNEKVWTGQHRIKKYIERSRIGWE